MVHVKWIVSVVSGIVLIAVGFVSFLGVSNLNEITKQLSENAKSSVRNEIDRQERNIGALQIELSSVLAAYDKNKAAIESLGLLRELAVGGRPDPHYA